MSLNIMPKRKGTVANMKIEGRISLYLGIEYSYVRMLTSNRQGSRGMIVLGFF